MRGLPLGGHIELHEDPEQAALREAKEESGLEVELLGERPPTTSPGTARSSRRDFWTFIVSRTRTNISV